MSVLRSVLDVLVFYFKPFKLRRNILGCCNLRKVNQSSFDCDMAATAVHV